MRMLYQIALRAFLWATAAFALSMMVAMAFGASGCKTAANTLLTSDSTSTTTIVRETMVDTALIAERDSAWAMLLVDCDSTNSAVIRDLQTKQGARTTVAPEVKTVPSTQALKIYVPCHVDTQALYAQFKLHDTVTQSTRTVYKTVPVEVERKLTWWQQFKIAYGGYAFLIIALFALGKLAIVLIKRFLPGKTPFIG